MTYLERATKNWTNYTKNEIVIFMCPKGYVIEEDCKKFNCLECWEQEVSEDEH